MRRFAPAILAIALVAPGGQARAQANAQAVLLRIQPHAGDTLHLRMDQSVELAGASASGTAATPVSGAHTMVILMRLAIDATDSTGSTVTATTDSVRLTSPDASGADALFGWARGMERRRLRFHVGLDGTTVLVSSGATAAAGPAGTLLTQLPAALPREAVKTGTTWTKSMEVPLVASGGATGTATLTTTFVLDSLTRGGELAWLSLRGRLARAVPGTPAGSTPVVETSGTLSGSVLMDRRRGWIRDARTLIELRSLVQEPKSRVSMPVRIRITQWMRIEQETGIRNRKQERDMGAGD